MIRDEYAGLREFGLLCPFAEIIPFILIEQIKRRPAGKFDEEAKRSFVP